MKRLLPVYCSSNSYKEFTKRSEKSILKDGINNIVDLNDDETHELAQELCEEILGAQRPNDEKILSVLQYMTLISTRAKGFVLEDIHIMENGKKKSFHSQVCTDGHRMNLVLNLL